MLLLLLLASVVEKKNILLKSPFKHHISFTDEMKKRKKLRKIYEGKCSNEIFLSYFMNDLLFYPGVGI